jgi:hypothetical protein
MSSGSRVTFPMPRLGGASLPLGHDRTATCLAEEVRRYGERFWSAH